MILVATDANQSVFSLRTGMIAPVSSVSDTLICRKTTTGFSTPILPLISYIPLAAKIYIEYDNIISMFDLEVPPPKGNLFQGGYQYNYLIDLVNDTIQFQ